jgi:Chaperone of endosialidase
MEHRSHASFTSKSIRFSLVAGLVVVLFIVGTTRDAAAQTDTNTALGTSALGHNTTGNDNTVLGFTALFENTTNSNNTAVGANALGANVAGDNTAIGANALFTNSGGVENTATGVEALYYNTTGGGNTAAGWHALLANTTGGNNTATGSEALFGNNTGNSNTATGEYALFENYSGGGNTAIGVEALERNDGSGNTAAGDAALESNTTGSGNIAVGSGAGGNLTTGNNNIDIGNTGIAGESGIIRIGTQGVQTHVVIAGISNTPFYSGSPVLVNAFGRLGIAVSSARFKRDIRDMGGASDRLMKLRPVAFRYKEDPNGTLQYGLVAEEVAKVYPELVTYGDDGKPLSVAYHLLPAMLLNELQKKDAQIAELRRQVKSLQKENARIDGLAARLSALEQQARETEP